MTCATLVTLCGSGTTGCHGWGRVQPRPCSGLGGWLVNGYVHLDDISSALTVEPCCSVLMGPATT